MDRKKIQKFKSAFNEFLKTGKVWRRINGIWELKDSSYNWATNHNITHYVKFDSNSEIKTQKIEENLKPHIMDEIYKEFNISLDFYSKNKKDKHYKKIQKYYAVCILKEYKKEKIKLKTILKINYTLNIILNYGLLKEDNPASLIDFKSLKISMIKNKRNKIKKLLKF